MRGDPSMGSPRMEVKKFAKSYSQLQQVLLEHAQMEEKVVFQILESADRGKFIFFLNVFNIIFTVCLDNVC